jgi:Tfp pilus assembly protein PilO
VVVCRQPLILGVDLVGLAALTALGAVLMMAPLEGEVATLPHLRQQAATTHQERAALAARNAAMEQALAAHEEYLREQAEQPLADVGTFVAHVSEQCRESGVMLERVQPLATSRGESYESWQVNVQARGTFPSFHALLHRIESWSPYVQVDDLLVIGPADATSRDCELAWTVRVNYLDEWPAGRGDGP